MLSFLNLLRWIFSLFAALLSMFNINIQKTTVEFYDNPTSGYVWEYEMDNASVVSLVESRYTPDSDSALSGKGGGTRYFTFEAISEGTVNITFRYKKHENDEIIVASEYIYQFTVDDDGTITQKNIE